VQPHSPNPRVDGARPLTSGANGPPRFVVAIALATIVCLTFAGLEVDAPRFALGMSESRPKQPAAVATPVPSPESSRDPLDGDPSSPDPLGHDSLDGDPLDGTPAPTTNSASPNGRPLNIVRSGRPEAAPQSLVAYDGDPRTVWAPTENEGDAWIWLDLGSKRRLRSVRWLARGSGAIEVSISDDRRRWQAIDSMAVRPFWQQVSLRDDAQFVRLDLQPSDDGSLPEIAEVSVYGRDAADEVSLAQKSSKNDRKGGKNQSKGKGSGKSESGSTSGGNSKKAKGAKSSSEGNITAEQGDTHCQGDRARCRAREGKVSVDDTCETDGTCTIDVQADGGSAMCGATGGGKAKAGKGKRKRGGEGGRCDAAADGGTVTIGDINP
jgi:hypothetical protein